MSEELSHEEKVKQARRAYQKSYMKRYRAEKMTEEQKERQRQYRREWGKKNPDKIKQYQEKTWLNKAEQDEGK